VWFAPTNGQAFDVQQEMYRGRPVLVWFRTLLGPASDVRPHRRPTGAGQLVIFDEHYRRVAALRARAPWTLDIHDASIVGGDIWITVIRTLDHQNLRPYGGPRDAVVVDAGLQEFQVSTGRLIRTWDALNPRGRPNVPLSASYERPSAGWDAYHLNSVQALPDGDLLISMRNTWAVYLLDPVNNRILWTLGGRRSSFRMGRRARFAWQHDARLVNPTDGGAGRNAELTLFDDDSSRRPAKGLVLSLDTLSHRARLVAAYAHHPSYYARILGSMQLLPNGNALVDWGEPFPYFTEFAPSGRVLLNVSWPGREQSYRTLFTNSWVGRPHYPPRGAVRGHTVYATWNGATQIARWEVMAGASGRALTVVASRPRTGFETAVRLRQTYAAYRVRALAGSGRVLGTSTAFR
jgi:hypothetical protein